MGAVNSVLRKMSSGVASTATEQTIFSRDMLEPLAARAQGYLKPLSQQFAPQQAVLLALVSVEQHLELASEWE
jgi:hypothetical protein